jgi:hypothetical protein
VDFWAQHKDFILKVLAGLGIFLVALIARSITYGDDLENAQHANAQLGQQIRAMRIAPVPEIQALKGDAEKLGQNAAMIARQIGWNVAEKDPEQELLTRILRYTRRYARQGENEVRRATEDFRQALRDDLNGGFGQLRLMVRQELVEEAGERNIKIAEGIGLENLKELESDELLQYLLQLELVARVVRYGIDAGVVAITDVKITMRQRGRGREEVIPGANLEFLEEYPVTVTFAASQGATLKILDRLEAEGPRVPLTGIKAQRLPKPADHLSVELTVRATAANTLVPFAAEKEKGS